MAPMNTIKDYRLLQWKRNLWLLFKLWFGHEFLKGLSYDAAKGFQISFHDELTLIDEIWVDPIFAGPTNPQGSERKERSEQGEKSWLQRRIKVLETRKHRGQCSLF